MKYQYLFTLVASLLFVPALVSAAGLLSRTKAERKRRSGHDRAGHTTSLSILLLVLMAAWSCSEKTEAPADRSTGNTTDSAIAVDFGENKGLHIWSKRYGDKEEQDSTCLAADSKNNILLAGSFQGTVSFGGKTLVANKAGGIPNDDIYVAKLSGAGEHVWSRSFGSDTNDRPLGIACDPSDNLLVTGTFVGSVDFGGGSLTSTGPGENFDIFLVKLDAAGKHLWSRSFGDRRHQAAHSLAVDAKGNVYLAGEFEGSVSFGGTSLTSAGKDDIFIAKLDSAGKHVWSKSFGDTRAFKHIAVDPTGGVCLAGDFENVVDFGGGNLTSAGDNDLFIAKFDEMGKHVFSKSYGSTGDQLAHGIAVDAWGNVLVTGIFESSLDFGGGKLTSAGNYDTFLVKLDKAGKHLWSKSFGGSGEQWGRGLAVDGAGSVILAGDFESSVDFGGGKLLSKGGGLKGYLYYLFSGGDFFIAKLNSAGGHLWSKSYGDSSSQTSTAIGVDRNGNILLTGSFKGKVDFGGGTLPSAGLSDIALLKLSH